MRLSYGCFLFGIFRTIDSRKLRFRSLSNDMKLTWDIIDYSYDNISRLISANSFSYKYDVSGNLVDMDGVTRIFNEANQMTNDGTNNLTYDNNGNLKNDGTSSYTWDRANRLSSVGDHEYVYDGLGNRVQQTVSSVVTDYLNDVQPSLTKLLKQDDGTNTDRFVHGLRGIHAVDDGTDWNYYAQDGLGSVRAIVDDAGLVQSSMGYDPYGNPMGAYGAGFGFTGEQTDTNGSVYLRARYYEPEKGMFSALDPWEGIHDRAMSLNGYSWVEGNVINMIDPSGWGCISHRIDGGGLEICGENSGGGNITRVSRSTFTNNGPQRPANLNDSSVPSSGQSVNPILQSHIGYASINPRFDVINEGICVDDLRWILEQAGLRPLSQPQIVMSNQTNNNSNPVPQSGNNSNASNNPKRWGNCDESQYNPLLETMEELCKRGRPTGCSKRSLRRLIQQLRQPGQRERDVIITRQHIQERIDNNLACQKARQIIQNTCYANSPDPAHVKEMNDLRTAKQRCINLRNSLP